MTDVCFFIADSASLNKQTKGFPGSTVKNVIGRSYFVRVPETSAHETYLVHILRQNVKASLYLHVQKHKRIYFIQLKMP